MKKRRTFSRDAYIGFRLPSGEKDRLLEHGRKRYRDASSIALEAIRNWLDQAEREESRRQPVNT